MTREEALIIITETRIDGESIGLLVCEGKDMEFEDATDAQLIGAAEYLLSIGVTDKRLDKKPPSDLIN